MDNLSADWRKTERDGEIEISIDRDRHRYIGISIDRDRHRNIEIAAERDGDKYDRQGSDSN